MRGRKIRGRVGEVVEVVAEAEVGVAAKIKREELQLPVLVILSVQVVIPAKEDHVVNRCRQGLLLALMDILIYLVKLTGVFWGYLKLSRLL